MCHLQPSSLVSAFDIKAFVCFAAIQYTLIAANLLCNEIKGLDEFQAELLALLIFCYRNILDMTDYAKVVYTADCVSMDLAETKNKRLTISSRPAELRCPLSVLDPR